MKQISQLSDLKKVISSYVKKCDNPSRESNQESLIQLAKLRKDPSKKKEYLKLRDKIALSNGGFGMKYVMMYIKVLNDDASISDLFQEAMLGILETIDEFDPDKKIAFTTYAFYHVRKRLIDFIKYNKLVRAPRDVARNIKHVNEAQEYLFSVEGREPTSSEIKTYLNDNKNINLKIDIIDSILILINLNSGGSDDTFISEYVEQVSCVDDMSIFKKLELCIKKELEKLDPTTREIIILRYGIGRECPHLPDEIRTLLNIDNLNIEVA